MRGPLCCPKCIPGYGQPNEGVVIVGIAPANQELKEGKPFMGQNGKLMDAVLKYTGWDRTRVYCTNIICHPVKVAAADVDLKDAQYKNCFARLEQELLLCKPRLVIPVGSVACQYFTGMKVGKARGVPVFNAKRGYYIMPTFQPVAALQGDPSVIHHLVRDFSKIPMILEWPQDGSIKDVKYTVVSTTQEAQSVLSSIESGTLVSLDIETDSEFVNIIDIHRDRLLCLAISYFDSTNGDQHTIVFPRSACDGLDWPSTVEYCYQNGPFDQKGMSKYLGVELPIDHDTLLMSYALDERGGRDEIHDSYGGIHGLGPQADEYCGAEFYKDKMKPGHKRPAQLDEHDLYKYNAYDAGYTTRLAQRYLPQLHEQQVYNLYHDRLLPLDRAFAEINYLGVPVDRKRLQDLILDWGPKFLDGEKALGELAQEYGYPGVLNPASPKQLSRFLYDILGLEGGPSTARDIIEELDHPFVDALLAHKRLSHIWQHYIVPGARSIKMDGRVHPNTMVHGTTSGRLAYSDPPLQTLPQDYTVGEYAEIRSIYVPESLDYVIMEFDYCLSKGTKVQTVHGNVPIEEVLVGEYVFGTMGDKPVVRKVIANRFTGTREVSRLTIDDGQSVLATREHRFQMYDESYKRLEELNVNDRLMPFRRAPNKKLGYIEVYTKMAYASKTEHVVIAEGIYENYDSTIHDVHHKDLNKSNNLPENLELKTYWKHQSEHGKEFWQNISKEDSTALRAKMGVSISKAVKDRGGHHGKNNPNYGNYAGVDSVCPTCGETFYRAPSLNAIYCGRDCYTEARNNGLNHKVLDIEYDVDTVDTYCLEVEECHNFVLECGIVSHNSQVEIWMAAGLSNDSHMLQALHSGDYHRATVRDVMRLPVDDMDPTEFKHARQMGKKVGFGVIYDIGAYTLSKPKTGINSTVPYAQQVIDTFYEVNWEYRDWTKRTIAQARTQGELITPFGRHRRFRLFVDKKQERQAINFPVQSIANDYTLSALLELHFGQTLEQVANNEPRPKQTELQRLGARIFFGVHDSIVIQVRKDRQAETYYYVKSIMEQQWLPDMPHGRIEAKAGPNLYDVKVYAPELVTA